MKLPKNNPIEILHMIFCKEILGVGKQTPNLGVLLELGRTPLTLECRKLCIKNWERIKKLKANDILIASYQDSMNDGLPWTQKIREVLEKNGMLCHFLNDYSNKPDFVHKKIFQTLVDSFHQDAFSSIKNSKLRTYHLAKSVIGMEKYLTEIRSLSERTYLSKLRLSNDRLCIESDRHKGVEAKFRFCPFCPRHVETEIHFMLDCVIYSHIREDLFHKMTQTNQCFPHLTSLPLLCNTAIGRGSKVY